jgi:hypothetical protein
MALQGKGMYIWQLHRVGGGVPQRMADMAAEAGLTHVLIKIADGTRAYNGALSEPATQAFHEAGLRVWGWAWLWMEDPLGEARIAADRCHALRLDGFVINAEHPAKGRSNQARAYMDELRRQLPGVPLALSSYRYPQLHTSFPWESFLTGCDWDMPQMYWVGETPADCVRRSLARHREFPFARPVIPTGSAYGEQYGSAYFRARPREVVEFLDAVQEHNLPAANFWSWDWAHEHGPDLWDAIARYSWPVAPEPELDVVERYWRALESGDLEATAGLYHQDAVYVTARAAVQGPDAIRTYLAGFVGSLPNVCFTCDGLRVEDPVRFLHWHAVSDVGRILDGLDTVGVRDGQIQYHASSYRFEPLT